jgi:molybdenum cofactor guanylyltransferase
LRLQVAQTLSMAHSAVLLAGGKSSRMGCDKAFIDFEGRPLWQHQLAKLRGTQPEEIFISAAEDAPYQGACQVVPDLQPGRGPLGGVVTALQKGASQWLLVLAVDVPFVSQQFLTSLIVMANETRRGVVPLRETGDLEPLIAVYPKAALESAEALLARGELRMKALVAELAAADLISTLPISPAIGAQLVNWNTPRDITSERRD